jgi:hypothetical protein
VKDERALALLRRLGDRLKSARSFTVRARTAVEAQVPGGMYATFFNEGRVALQRPDKLAVSRTRTRTVLGGQANPRPDGGRLPP